MQEHTVTLSELSELAAQFTLSSRQISDAIAAARDNALQRGRDTTIDESCLSKELFQPTADYLCPQDYTPFWLG